MVSWDWMYTWRGYLVSLARGLCTCSLVLLYLFINLVICSGYRTTRTAPFSHLEASLGKEPTGPSSSSAAEEMSPAISETPHVGLGAPFQAPVCPHLVDERSRTLDTQESTHLLVIPKIIVQDFSANDGLVRYKTPEYDPTHTLKRRRRPSWARIATPFEDHHAVTTRSSFRLPPTSGVPAVEGSQPSHPVDGLKHRRSDVLVQNLAGFPGRRRRLGDVVAKDGSFVIAGL